MTVKVADDFEQADIFQDDVNRVYPLFCDAIVGVRKDATLTALSLLIAEICLLKVSESVARADATSVAASIQDNITRILLARAPVYGMMN
jgi:hypothetical protein